MTAHSTLNTTTFTWDVNRSILQMLDDETDQRSPALSRVEGSTAAGASPRWAPGGTHHYLTDGLGSTLALTDEAGDVVNTYDYDVFGALRAETGS